MIQKLQRRFALSRQGAVDLIKGCLACVLQDISFMFPVGLLYALAALRISISRWQLDLSALLASLQEEEGAATNKKTLADYARALSGEDE